MTGALATLLGGIGLFLLGMWLMTEGLKLSAGAALQRILQEATRTRARGLAAGVGITALVQSSSAVTVATIGFVNAGLLQLSQSLWVLFGANVGTTMTGWLVALIGLQFKVEALALPLVGIGMVLRLTGERERRGALGMAIAGFGVLFLGIGMLQGAFAGTQLSLPDVGGGVLGVIVQLLAGMLLTVLTQSSSAAMAIALTAAQGGTLGLEAAAAVVIGANIGTTIKAILAALGATSNAKRAAAAHIVFNLLTGAVALLLLPWLVGWLRALQEWLGLGAGPALTLALFHTLFNVLGVALMWPLADRLSAFLMQRFRSQEEDAARPRFLDETLLQVPSLAVQALAQEIRRAGQEVLAHWQARRRPPQGLAGLHVAIAHYVTRLHAASMSAEQAQRLTQLLRASRDIANAGELLDAALAVEPTVLQAAAGAKDQHLLAFDEEMARLQAWMAPRLRPREPAGNGAPADTAMVAASTDRSEAMDITPTLDAMHERYDALKDHWLALTAAGVRSVPALEAGLRLYSLERRTAEHLVRAAQTLERGEREREARGTQEAGAEADLLNGQRG